MEGRSRLGEKVSLVQLKNTEDIKDGVYRALELIDFNIDNLEKAFQKDNVKMGFDKGSIDKTIIFKSKKRYGIFFIPKFPFIIFSKVYKWVFKGCQICRNASTNGN